jgi:glucose-6-phosphate 1-dehydrogenase
VELVAIQHPGGTMKPYERLLGDAMRGDVSLFARQEAVEEAWRVVDPIVGGATPLHEYEPGTWGPREADALIASHGRWRPVSGTAERSEEAHLEEAGDPPSAIH